MKKSLRIRSAKTADRGHRQDWSRRIKSFRWDILKKIKLRNYLIGLRVYQGNACYWVD